MREIKQLGQLLGYLINGIIFLAGILWCVMALLSHAWLQAGLAIALTLAYGWWFLQFFRMKQLGEKDQNNQVISVYEKWKRRRKRQ